MNRAAGDSSSDVAAADSRGDTLYRRPIAHPPAETTTGGSWFTDGTEIPAASPGPASGARPASAPAHAAFVPAAGAAAAFAPAAAAFAPAAAPSAGAAPAFAPAAAANAGAAPAAANSRASFGFSDDPISPVRHGPTSAPPAPPSAGWPPPARLDPDDAQRAPSGEHNAWRSDTAERRTAAPSGEPNAWRTDTGERHVARRDPPAAAPPPPAPRQSRVVTVGLGLLTALVLVLGSIAGVTYFTGADPVLPLGNGSSTAGRTVTAPLDKRTKASFELLAGANSVRVTIGELGDDLYRISTPDDAGFRPSPTIRNDDVKLQVSKDGDGTGGEIEVVLAAKVRWQLRFSGYAEKQVIDLSGGRVSGIEMVAAMKQAEVTLAKPSGTVPLKINGAVDKLILKSPADNPVRIKVGGGAQSVVAGSKTLKDVAAGSTLTPKGWDTADRYDVTAGARITALTIENA